MLNYTETASIGTNVSPSSVPTMGSERETEPLPSLRDFDTYVLLRIGKARYRVSRTLEDGYLAACKAYEQMAEEDEWGPYLFLTGYEYAHLARQHMPADIPSTHKRARHRGFLLGWNVCTFGLDRRPRKK